MPVLLSSELNKTCLKLRSRIADRFPTSGLLQTCDKLLLASEASNKTIQWIKQPNYIIRSLSWGLIGILIIFLARTWFTLNITISGLNAADFIQMIDAGLNAIILLGASGIFLMTFEDRRKRKRVMNAVNKLRCIAHLVDAHQLTKDPSYLTEQETANSPTRELTGYELGRYLDYCAEMLSLSAKIAFLYVQDFDDPIANESVNDLESLTIGISQKVWQKITLLKRS